MNFQLKKPSAVLKHINSTTKKQESGENISDNYVKVKNNEKNKYVFLLLFIRKLNLYS